MIPRKKRVAIIVLALVGVIAAGITFTIGWSPVAFCYTNHKATPFPRTLHPLLMASVTTTKQPSFKQCAPAKLARGSYAHRCRGTSTAR